MYRKRVVRKETLNVMERDICIRKKKRKRKRKEEGELTVTHRPADKQDTEIETAIETWRTCF